jgi:IS5 family transposase
MATDFVDIALMEADGQLLRDVSTMSIDDEQTNAEPVLTMNPERRALGSKKGTRQVTGTIETRIRRPRERWQLKDFRVTGISKSHSNDGESTESITFLALDHFRETF